MTNRQPHDLATARTSPCPGRNIARLAYTGTVEPSGLVGLAGAGWLGSMAGGTAEGRCFFSKDITREVLPT